MARVGAAHARHMTRLSIWMQGDDPYAAYFHGSRGSGHTPPALLLDLWNQDMSGHTLVHVAGVSLSQRLLTWFGVSATVAPLGLLVLLTRLQHLGRARKRRTVAPADR